MRDKYQKARDIGFRARMDGASIGEFPQYLDVNEKLAWIEGWKEAEPPMSQTSGHPERGDLDKMTKKPASVQRELAEARRILSRVIVPPEEDESSG